jgi:myosin heavy subunit
LFDTISKGEGKTILTKFSKEIDDLMQELTSSNVHFIRCIKPNERKAPGEPDERYILTQVRYLGVFETIQIRKKTFSSRWLYNEFIQRFETLFPACLGDDRSKTQKILSELTSNCTDYLLGNQRVYMNSELESQLLKRLHEALKHKTESSRKIWRNYKKYRMRQ